MLHLIGVHGCHNVAKVVETTGLIFREKFVYRECEQLREGFEIDARCEMVRADEVRSGCGVQRAPVGIEIREALKHD